MNNNLLDDTSFEKANKMSGLLEDELDFKLKKESDVNVLNELRLIFYNLDQEKFMKKVTLRINELGGKLKF